jgi:imidazolonepropionase-like amidohydrolase
MDPESNVDAIRNVGVKDGKIAAITADAIRGRETINASGHVVAPGFIDGHVHVGIGGSRGPFASPTE